MRPLSADASSPPRLDVGNERLMCGMRAVPLRPKTFAVLRCLADHPGRLVTKEALVRAAWPGTAVSEGGLMVCIRELREALRDDARTPRYIETVHRRGYRLIGEIVVADEPDGGHEPHRRESSSPGLLVGRAAELECLGESLAHARRGEHRLVFVTGEAGIGKSALVEVFAAEARRHGGVVIGIGQCVEPYGVGEPYLPVLDALGRLCRQPDGRGLVERLARDAPTWLVQMPGLLETANRQVVQERVLGATRDRMLREFGQALLAVTASRTLILVLEDLHWSDQSTLDLLLWLARSSQPTRLMVIGTWRPAEISHVHTLHAELAVRTTCRELLLGFLSEPAVAAYVEARFPGRRIPAGLARSLRARTDGNPLFMVNVVDDWLGQGALAEVGDELLVRVSLGQLETAVPENLRTMIDRHVDRLAPDEQRVLEVASIAGVEFSAASVAAGLDEDVIGVEACCDRLSRRRHVLQADPEKIWPDGTVAGGYRFVHALYAEAISRRVTPGRRAHLHRRLGERQEAAWAGRAPEIAAELSMHFERGQDSRRAVVYRRHAAANALRRSAHVEAVDHLCRAVALFERLPPGRSRLRLELELRIALGTALMAVKGYGAAEVEANYLRAREVGEQLGTTTQLFPMLNGLRRVHLLPGELTAAHEFGERCLSLAEAAAAPKLLVQAHCGLGVVLSFIGDFAGARRHAERGAELYDTRRHVFHAIGSADDPGVGSFSYAGLALWYLGYPDQAVERLQTAIRIAREQAHPFSMAYALVGAAWLHQYRREPQAVRDHAEAVMALSREHAFPLRHAQAVIMAGWALAASGNPTEAIAQIRRGLAAFKETGARVNQTYYLSLLATAHGEAGQRDHALGLLENALEIAGSSGERLWEAELHRLRGEFVLGDGTARAVRSAEACFFRALDVARQQQARSLELRAAVSLSRLWRRRGQHRKTIRLLGPIYGSFTEGLDTPDLSDARKLLKAESDSIRR